MINSKNRVYRTLSRLKARVDRTAIPLLQDSEQPQRYELSSTRQLESHAAELAERHQVDPKPGKDLLLPRLAENEAILLNVNELLTGAVAENLRITPASEEFLDNFYMIEKQILMARQHLPKGYSKELPHMLNGSLAGYPRIYDIAKELIVHTDGRVDAESLKRFVDAYQIKSVLNLGELWAVAIMLRLALIENLRHISLRITLDRIDRNLANRWADQIIKTAETDPKSLIIAVADLARSDPPLSSAFVTEFARKLEGRGQVLNLPLIWIEERLSEAGKSIGHLVQEDIQQRLQIRSPLLTASLAFVFLIQWTGKSLWRERALSRRHCALILQAHTSRWILPLGIATAIQWRALPSAAC